MTAIDRLASAVIAADLMALDTVPQHAARLARHLASRPRPATTLADLAVVPRWLRDDADSREALARCVALAHAAPALARSIDGRRLHALADLVSVETLDWAIALGNMAAAGNAARLPDPASLAATGFALLASTLPPALAARLDAEPAPRNAAARAAVEAALDHQGAWGVPAGRAAQPSLSPGSAAGAAT